MAPSRVWAREERTNLIEGALGVGCVVDEGGFLLASVWMHFWRVHRIWSNARWKRGGVLMPRSRTGQGRQANPVAVILPRVEWQAAYVTDYSRYDNDTPGASNATRREDTTTDQQQHRRRESRRRNGAAARDPDKNTPTRISLPPSLIHVAWANAERRDAYLLASAVVRVEHPSRVQIMTAAVVMENVNWDPGKCKRTAKGFTCPLLVPIRQCLKIGVNETRVTSSKLINATICWWDFRCVI